MNFEINENRGAKYPCFRSFRSCTCHMRISKLYIANVLFIQSIVQCNEKCLKDATTGELVQTEVIRIKRRTFLRKYNKKNGWYVNWEELLGENEIYALVVEGSVDIQGLVALAKDEAMKAVYIAWMCCNPENNKMISANIRYYGVGGHLFAIAAQKSAEYGYGGFMYGYAANQTLLEHYVSVLHAEHIGVLHPYQFAIDEENAEKIMGTYDYEWTDEEI